MLLWLIPSLALHFSILAPITFPVRLAVELRELADFAGWRGGPGLGPAADLRFEHLTVDQGRAHGNAKAVTQDRAAFIWVSTI